MDETGKTGDGNSDMEAISTSEQEFTPWGVALKKELQKIRADLEILQEQHNTAVEITRRKTNANHQGTSNSMEKAKTSIPFTPPRRLNDVPPYNEEISPTDSNFSLRSVFDSPVDAIRFDENANGDDGDDGDFSYAATEASSLDGDDEDEVKARLALLNSPVEDEPDTPIAAHLSTTDLVSPAQQPTTPTTDSPGDDATTPPPIRSTHRIWLTSCLQCVLADLPCSRTLPSCTRCARNGAAELCLVQRKRFHAEFMADTQRVEPLLVTLPEDREELTRSKMVLQEEVSAMFSFFVVRWEGKEKDGLMRDAVVEQVARGVRAEVLVSV